MSELDELPTYEALSEIAYPPLSVHVDVANVLKAFMAFDAEAGGDMPNTPADEALAYLRDVKAIFDPQPTT